MGVNTTGSLSGVSVTKNPGGQTVFTTLPMQGSLTEGEGSVQFDLLVLTSSDLLLFLLKILISLFTKRATLFKRSFVLSLPFQLVFPALWYFLKCWRLIGRLNMLLYSYHHFNREVLWIQPWLCINKTFLNMLFTKALKRVRYKLHKKIC